VTKRNKPF